VKIDPDPRVDDIEFGKLRPARLCSEQSGPRSWTLPAVNDKAMFVFQPIRHQTISKIGTVLIQLLQVPDDEDSQCSHSFSNLPAGREDCVAARQYRDGLVIS
jgi:hypothetical protein